MSEQNTQRDIDTMSQMKKFAKQFRVQCYAYRSYEILNLQIHLSDEDIVIEA